MLSGPGLLLLAPTKVGAAAVVTAVVTQKRQALSYAILTLIQ